MTVQFIKPVNCLHAAIRPDDLEIELLRTKFIQGANMLNVRFSPFDQMGKSFPEAEIRRKSQAPQQKQPVDRLQCHFPHQPLRGRVRVVVRLQWLGGTHNRLNRKIDCVLMLRACPSHCKISRTWAIGYFEGRDDLLVVRGRAAARPYHSNSESENQSSPLPGRATPTPRVEAQRTDCRRNRSDHRLG